MLGVMASYAVSLCSISRCYVISTFLVVGVGLTYLRIAAVEGFDVKYPRGWRSWMKLLLVNLALLAATYVLASRIIHRGNGL